jgi:hypothetical protein
MHVVVVMMMMRVVMMVVMHLVHFASGRWGRFLRDGVTGEADCESGGGEKALNHGRTILRLTDREGSTCGTLRRIA